MDTIYTYWWTDLFVVLVAIFLTLTAGIKMRSSIPYGLVAIFISCYLGVMTFTKMSPLWTLLLVLVVTALYAIGLHVFDPEDKESDRKDDKWHFLALFVALIGKAFLATGPVFWAAINGTRVPIWTWLLVGGIVAFIFMARSRRVKKKVSDTFSKPDSGDQAAEGDPVTTKEPAPAAST